MNKNKQSLYIRRCGMTTHAFMNGKTTSTKCFDDDEYNFAFGAGIVTANLLKDNIDD